MHAPAECVRAFLQGLFDTDGTANKPDGHIEFATVSEKLAKKVQLLLLQFGIVARLSFKNNNHAGCWRLLIYGDAELFYDRVGFRLERKQSIRESIKSPRGAKTWTDTVPHLPQITEGPVYNGKINLTIVHDGKKYSMSQYTKGVRAPGYKTLRIMATAFPQLEYLCDPEYYWAKVVQVNDTGEQPCYDFTVPGIHAFVSNGIVSHNSSLALIMADHMAYVQGYDVLMLHLETSAISLADRIMARKLQVQPREFRTAANFDINSPKLSQRVEAVKKEIAEAEKHRGIIYYHHCPGATVEDIEAKIAEQQAIAEGHHRELVVLLDYYQKIDWSTLAQREVDGFNKVAAELKNLAELYGIYLVTFAQFNMDAQYSDKKTAWNGSGIVMYSQTVVRIEREEAQDDRPMLDKSGQPVQDLLGYPIYYHRRGQPSSHTILNVIMANDDEPGPVEVDFVNGYFMVEDTEANRVAGNREFMSQVSF